MFLMFLLSFRRLLGLQGWSRWMLGSELSSELPVGKGHKVAGIYEIAVFAGDVRYVVYLGCSTDLRCRLKPAGSHSKIQGLLGLGYELQFRYSVCVGDWMY